MGQDASVPQVLALRAGDGHKLGNVSRALFRRFRGGSRTPTSKVDVRPVPGHLLFPKGLGPCGVWNTQLRRGDPFLVEGLDGSNGGGVAFFPRPLFSRSAPLTALAARIDHVKGWTRLADGTEALASDVSVVHSLTLPRASRRNAGVPDTDEVRFLWVYPARLDWAGIFAEAVECLDPGDPDISFFAVGGYLHFKAASSSPRKRGDSGSPARSVNGGAVPSEAQLLGATALAYDPQGVLQFAAPRLLEPPSAERLAKLGRFQPVVVQQWAARGAKYFAWVRPGEQLPDAEGRERPLTNHGALAFIFRDLKVPDTEGQDRFFEVACAPDFMTEATSSASSSTSLPFGIAAVSPAHRRRQLARIFDLASRSQWQLVFHLLTESPQFAAECDDRGETLLHHCARHRVQDRALLEQLREGVVPYDARSAAGLSAEDVGDAAFRRLVRELWGRAPDVFEDSERWFVYWDRNANGRLDPDELSEALIFSYGLTGVSQRWARSFANAHHPGGVSKAQFLSPQGLLHELRFSLTLAELGKKSPLPPLFREGLRPLRDEDCAQLVRLEERLAAMRAQNGWQPGSRAPQGAHRLQMPSPFPGAGLDTEARMRNARQMLSFSLAQTATASAKAWQRGFRVNFSGQDGVDDGGLTKAWGQELAFALWGNNDYFDTCGADWCFFKPDTVEQVQLDGQPVQSTDLYKWAGRFVAYLLYQHCLIDCCLSPWTFRALQRIAVSPEYLHQRSQQPAWPETPEGDDRMLEDLSSLDPALASGLWRVHHEMTDEELKWLDFTCFGSELVPGGADIAVSSANKAQYVRLCCTVYLMRRSRLSINAFAEGFLDVLPAEILSDIVEGGTHRLLLGAASLTDAELSELERLVVPAGLVPVKLRDHPRVRDAARWFFQAARAGDANFRARLLEFWIGTPRVPLTGVQAIQPRPKLQVMVQPDGRGVKRISSWPRERLPEGHTCGNELWLPLQDTYEQTVDRLRLAVENFEAGFALR